MVKAADPIESLGETLRALAADPARTDELAEVLATAAQPFAFTPLYEKYFPIFERYGLHLTPAHFYHPVPDTRLLDESLWEEPSQLVGVELNESAQLSLLKDTFPRFRDEYDAFPHTAEGEPYEFHFDNELFSGADALVLYCMVRHFRPKLVIEIGAGFSTRIAAQAARRNGDTSLISIDPHPDEIVRAGFPGLSELIPQPAQRLDVSFFDQLGAGDVLFIDGSHVVNIGSDVNFLFLEVLPRLRPGVIVHVHDVFLPREYRRSWVMEQFRFWTEQYLLHAFLIFNSEYEVLFSTNFIAKKHQPLLRECFPKAPWCGGLSFWMRRRAGAEQAR